MHKEAYFTPETITANSQEMIAALLSGKIARDYRPSPEQSALLVLDMQNYFLAESSHAFVPSAPAIIPHIQALARAFYIHHRPVVFTRHLNTPQDAGQMVRWWRDLIQPDSPLSQINTAFDTSQGVIIPKNQYDAFLETPLQGLLRENSVTQVVISGVMTHLCCETTARSAFMRGFEVFFTVDGTATYNRGHHMASLLNLAHGFATPLLVQDILSIFNKNAT